jgi:hypothetical protein
MADCSDDTLRGPSPSRRARAAAGLSPPGCGLMVFTTMTSGKMALKAWPARMTVRSRKLTWIRRQGSAGQAGLREAHGRLDAALELGHPTAGLIHVQLPPWLRSGPCHHQETAATSSDASSGTGDLWVSRRSVHGYDPTQGNPSGRPAQPPGAMASLAGQVGLRSPGVCLGPVVRREPWPSSGRTRPGRSCRHPAAAWSGQSAQSG